MIIKETTHFFWKWGDLFCFYLISSYNLKSLASRLKQQDISNRTFFITVDSLFFMLYREVIVDLDIWYQKQFSNQEGQ